MKNDIKRIDVICKRCHRIFPVALSTYKKRGKKATFNCPECVKTIQIESNKKRHMNESNETRMQHINMMNSKRIDMMKSMSLEDKKCWYDKSHKWYHDLSDEEKKKISDKHKLIYDSLPDDVKKKNTEMLIAEGIRYWDMVRDGLVLHDTSKISEYQINKWHNMSDAERKNIEERGRKFATAQWNNMSEEDKQFQINTLLTASKEYQANMTNTERLYLNKKISNGKKKSWALLSEEDKSNIMRKVFISSNLNNKFHKKFESTFNSNALTTQYILKPEYVMVSGEYSHSWDYGIFDKFDNLIMVVDLDGAYFHANICDYDGLHSKEEYDRKRFKSLYGHNVKFMIFHELRFDESFSLMKTFLDMSYDEFIDYQFKLARTMPFPYPTYSSDELYKSYNKLAKINSEYDSNVNNRICDRLIYHFQHSIFHNDLSGISAYDTWYNDTLLMDLIKDKNIYIDKLNPNKISQSFINEYNCFISPSIARMLICKHLNEYNNIFNPYHDTCSIMIAALSLHKKYTGVVYSDIIIRESFDLMRFLCYNEDNVSLDINASEHQDCLFIYSNAMTDKDVVSLMGKFKCTKYLFVINRTLEFKKYIVDKTFDGKCVLKI